MSYTRASWGFWIFPEDLLVNNQDMLTLTLAQDPKSGGLTLYKSGGQNPQGGWNWIPIGKPIASGLGGPGSAIRLADLDGDG